MTATTGLITLTSDFGIQDSYVAAMKAVILGIHRDARLVDVTHNVQPQDVMEGAYILRNVAHQFPAGTVHLAVVDPGVGTDRTPLALVQDGQFFVGPDNGLFSLILSNAEPEIIVSLDNSEFWSTPTPSATFHGRDVFAPVAAYLARGVPLRDLGTEISSIKTMHWALPISDEQGIQGWVVHVDRFGNCITNISRRQFREGARERSFKCYAGNAIISDFHTAYEQASPGDPTLLFNSSDMLEIAIYRESASSLLDIRKGAPVNLVFTDDKT